MVSVSKRMFKRAVRRNLLKRRLRESYRTQKDLLGQAGPLDLLLVYNSKEILDYQVIRQDVAAVLQHIAHLKEETV
ncbi:MAG: ribonuclease P protein component, partial [Bacteroidales bacterium]|nr:ribonuclease P protein component [Bacteroidales bacterium]